MDIRKQKFALAAAAVMGGVYLLCAAFVYLAPEVALRLFGWLVHLVAVDEVAATMGLTAQGILAGLLQTLVYTYVLAWIFATLHERFLAEGREARGTRPSS